MQLTNEVAVYNKRTGEYRTRRTWIAPWFVWELFIRLGIDSRYFSWRTFRRMHHKPLLDSDGYCVRCD